MAQALAPCSFAFTARPCAPHRLASALVLPAASSGLMQRRAAAGLAGEGGRVAAAGNAAAQEPAALNYSPPFRPAEPAASTLAPRRRCLRVCADAAAAAPGEPSGQLKDSRSVGEGGLKVGRLPHNPSRLAPPLCRCSAPSSLLPLPTSLCRPSSAPWLIGGLAVAAAAAGGGYWAVTAGAAAPLLAAATHYLARSVLAKSGFFAAFRWGVYAAGGGEWGGCTPGATLGMAGRLQARPGRSACLPSLPAGQRICQHDPAQPLPCTSSPHLAVHLSPPPARLATRSPLQPHLLERAGRQNVLHRRPAGDALRQVGQLCGLHRGPGSHDGEPWFD